MISKVSKHEDGSEKKSEQWECGGKEREIRNEGEGRKDREGDEKADNRKRKKMPRPEGFVGSKRAGASVCVGYGTGFSDLPIIWLTLLLCRWPIKCQRMSPGS